MVQVNPTITDAAGDSSAKSVQWGPLTTTNPTGAPIQLTQWSDRSVQFTGTFGASGTVSFQGSNDGTNFYPIQDSFGTAINAKTAAGIFGCNMAVGWVQPVLTGGDGTSSITATMICRRTQQLHLK